MPLAAIQSDDSATSGSDQPGDEKTSPSMQPLEGLRVLVVEDEPDARELLLLTLECQAPKVEAVTSAQEALDNLQVFKPDVLAERHWAADRKRIRVNSQSAVVGFRGQQYSRPRPDGFRDEKDRQLAISRDFKCISPKPVDPKFLLRPLNAWRTLITNPKKREPKSKNNLRRCHWAGSELLIAYHDREWAYPSTTIERS